MNFAHVRHIFFSGSQREAKGISPFISVIFEKKKLDLQFEDVRFEYWSAKRTAMVANTQSVVLSHGDMHWLSQRDCLQNEKLWKIYWWGGHRDEALIRRLDAEKRMSDLPALVQGATITSGRGFEVLSTGRPSDWLKEYKELPAKLLTKYGPQSLRGAREVPDRVYRKGQREIYSGRRLLVGRGIKSGGFITARFETKKYCFRNSIHGVRFNGLDRCQEAVITAIFWSSLARYYYFATIGSWGLWHDEIHLENIQEMPIRFPDDTKLRERLTGVVEEFQNLQFDAEGMPLASAQVLRQVPELEQELDEAVFELYELTNGERDLVRDMCTVGLDLFYRNQNSDSLREVIRPPNGIGTMTDLREDGDGLSAYLLIFLKVWNAELGPDAEFVWGVLSPPSGAPLIAVSFTTHYKSQSVTGTNEDEGRLWRAVLGKLGQMSRTQVHSARIFVDSFFRYVSETEILFVKRNERRFWTRTAAREDAESALTYLMNSDSAQDGS